MTTQALTAPTSFAVTGGVPASLTSLAARMYDDGIKKVRIVTLDSPQAGAFINIVNNALQKSRGFSTIDPVLFPLDPSADDSAFIQSAINGADGIVLAQTLGQDTQTSLTTSRQ